MIKIAHFGDTHIKNLHLHKEYREVFSKIYDVLREERPDVICHGGDIAHLKTQISPEFVELCGEFLKNLADIAPLFISLGNHDGLIHNLDRQDAISPIVRGLNHPRITLMKKSGEYKFNDDITFNALSIFDKKNWLLTPTEPEKINIALYHGSIGGCETDLGWVMEHTDNDISIFKEFDYALLADIHKSNQAIDRKGKMRWCGSTISQNFGESNDKGFLVWEIKDKDNFDCRHISIPNPKPFITIALEEDGTLPANITIPKDAKLRISSNLLLTKEQKKKLEDVVKTSHKINGSITWADGKKLSLATGSSAPILKEDLKSSLIQENLIKEYLKDYNVSEETLKQVFSINEKYNKVVLAKDKHAHTQDFEIKKLYWDNLFNYGPGNVLDFSSLHGVVGIFGKNFSGKSSIIDSLLYCLYNDISKHNRKNFFVVNKNKQSGSAKLHLTSGGKEYTISRNTEKYIKKLYGQETQEAKTGVEFSVEIEPGQTESLNGLDRIDTDKNITDLFGTMDDFLLTSMSSQRDALSFLDKRSTERKEILAKFLDLDLFADKHEIANKDIGEMKVSVRRLENKNFDAEVQKASSSLVQITHAIEQEKGNFSRNTALLQERREELAALEATMKLFTAKSIDISAVELKINGLEEQMNGLRREGRKIEESIVKDQTTLDKIQEVSKTFDIESIKKNKTILVSLEKELDNLIQEELGSQKELNSANKKASLLKEVPCGDQFPACKFIKDAYEAEKSINLIKKVLESKNSGKQKIGENIQSLNPAEIENKITKWNFITEQKNTLEKNILSNKLLLSSKQDKLSKLEKIHQEANDLANEYELHKVAIEEFIVLGRNRDILTSKIDEVSNSISISQDTSNKLHSNMGSLEERMKLLEKEKKELEDARKEYEAYELFLKCMSSSGITYDIIKNSLASINTEIGNILSGITEYEVFFETDDNKLEVYLRHPNEVAVPIELCSGSERTIAAMAIRLVLIKISSIPKCSLFILDEPGVALDSDQMDVFIQLLEVIKNSFKCVLLISHLDILKDCADSVIDITKTDGGALVRCE